jgi:hypothetical protein
VAAAVASPDSASSGTKNMGSSMTSKAKSQDVKIAITIACSLITLGVAVSFMIMY